MEQICPSELAEEWDNCGIQINTEFQDVYRVLTALEVTSAVIDEAVEKKVDMIVTHHPLIFRGMKEIDYNNTQGSYVYRLIREGCSVYSCHTSFDKMEGGNNDYIGQVLGIRNIEPFEEDNGFCRKGITPIEITFRDFLRQTALALNVSERLFRAVGDMDKTICTVGWCTGAGTEFLEDACREGCDLFITGDLKYHDARTAAELGLCVLDAGHYGTEQIFVDIMSELLSRKTNCDIIKSSIDINPFIW